MFSLPNMGHIKNALFALLKNNLITSQKLSTMVSAIIREMLLEYLGFEIEWKIYPITKTVNITSSQKWIKKMLIHILKLKKNQLINWLNMQIHNYFFPEDVCYNSYMLRFVANKRSKGKQVLPFHQFFHALIVSLI